MRAKRFILAALAASLLTACGAGIHNASVLAPALQSKGTAILKIAVPKKTATNARSSDYVSPATTQLSIDIQQSGVSVSGYPQTVGLTPTSAGCTSTLANTICELTISLAPGSYTATLTAMDASNNVLSSAQSIAFTITPGTSNTISLTLSGVPKEIQVLPLDNVTTPGSGAQSYTLLGAGAHRFLAVALDADGNTIIGPGAPSFSASISGFTGTIGQPTTARPNIFTVTPPSTFDTATGSVAVTASYAGQATDGCAQSGAVCSASIAVNMKELIAIPYSSEVDLYEQGQSSALVKIALTKTVFAAAFDSSGNLFVGETGGTIQEFTPPFSSGMSAAASITAPVTSGISTRIVDLVCDNAGHLYATAGYKTAVGGYPAYVVDRFPIPLSSGTTLLDDSVTGGAQQIGMAVDSSGDVFAAADQHPVTEFAPDGTSTAFSGITGQFMVAVAPNGTLAVSDGTAISYYSSPYTGSAFATESPSSPVTIAFDSSGNSYASSSGSPFALYAFASPYSSAAYASPTTSSIPYLLGATSQNELFVRVSTTIYQYALPLTSSSSAVASYPTTSNTMIGVAP